MASDEKPKAPVGERLRDLWPDIRDLVIPRRGTLVLGLVLILISRAAGFILPASSKFVIDDVIGQGRIDLLLPIVLAVLAGTLVDAGTSYALTQLLSKSGQRLIAEMRRKVQHHVGRLSVGYYDTHKTGTLVSRIMSDVEGVRNLVGTGLVRLIGGLMTAVVAFGVLMFVNATLTLIAMIIVCSFIYVLQLAMKTLRPAFAERRKIQGEVSGRLTESLGGVRVVKGYHAEQREHEVFSAGVERLMQNIFQTLTGTSLVGVAATVLLGLLSALIMWSGAHQITSGAMTLGDFALYTAFLAVMIAPLFQIVDISTQLMEAVSGLERTREVLREKPEDEDPNRQVEMSVIEGLVEFDDVHFAYEEGKPVLHGVGFESRPDTVTALVGSSGSGKSTIIGLVAAFHTPQVGRVLVDGVDLSKVKLSDYRSQLGVVLQESFLFDGTVRENITFARPGAGEEEFLNACRIARVDEFADRFELGYDTIVGERGVKLSGGQRQRVSIARAVLADPRILILDEATSSLDSESERLIQQGLAYLMRGRTTFVIAHRLSTIRRADQILVIEGGRILEHGDHDRLYAAQGRYRDLYDQQHGLEQNLFLAPGEGDKLKREPPNEDDDESAGRDVELLSRS